MNPSPARTIVIVGSGFMVWAARPDQHVAERTGQRREPAGSGIRLVPVAERLAPVRGTIGFGAGSQSPVYLVRALRSGSVPYHTTPRQKLLVFLGTIMRVSRR